ncbi:hypothetical protein AVEN_78913-1 [Araneus ventricosus]|uniref:Secreted protein n=1 Tax=Araneus ventricosus TaxID=182803 RepID=A0A4Y2EAQ3_ARAVE|nr:hypothetical protein AVEN_78913-1 [Araneus ventricosus]
MCFREGVLLFFSATLFEGAQIVFCLRGPLAIGQAGNLASPPLAGGFQVRNPIPQKIRRVWSLLHVKSYVGVKRPPAGVVRKLGEGDAGSGVVVVI